MTATVSFSLFLFFLFFSSGDSDRDVFNEKPSREEILAATQVSAKPRMRGFVRTEVLMSSVSVVTPLLEAKPLCYRVCPGDVLKLG